ncbi:MAG: hypothetical protein WC593_07320 [Methanoregula sp.]
MNNEKWTFWHTIAMVILVISLVVVGLFVTPVNRFASWIVVLLLISLSIIAIGHGVTGRLFGFIIDGRNKMSLSRLQLTLWTIVVLSSIFTIAFSNVINNNPSPLLITIPPELWILIGISTTSFVGSSLILNGKKETRGDPSEKQTTLSRLGNQGYSTGKIISKGVILSYKTPAYARVSDLFKGDETGNGAILDLSKIQMFFFTIIIVLIYAFAISTLLLAKTTMIVTMPPFDEGFLFLIGISHSGYLTYKAVPHTSSQNSPTK